MGSAGMTTLTFGQCSGIAFRVFLEFAPFAATPNEGGGRGGVREFG